MRIIRGIKNIFAPSGDQENPRLLDKDSFKALFISMLAVVAGLLFLSWQYNNLAEDRIPEIEKKVEQQAQELESQKAQTALVSFLEARVAGNTERARQHLTEEAASQVEGGNIQLGRDAESYRILRRMEGRDAPTFQVELTLNEAPFSLTEVITMKKISEQYYIDSVEIAG